MAAPTCSNSPVTNASVGKRLLSPSGRRKRAERLQYSISATSFFWTPRTANSPPKRQVQPRGCAKLLKLPARVRFSTRSFSEQHPDHQAASAVLLEAVRGTNLDFHCFSYEVWTPLFPNCLIEIDSVIELEDEPCWSTSAS